MTEKEKIEYIEAAMAELLRYSTELNEHNLKEFEIFKSSILNIMNEDESIRFRQITFYKEVDPKSDFLDDLPF